MKGGFCEMEHDMKNVLIAAATTLTITLSSGLAFADNVALGSNSENSYDAIDYGSFANVPVGGSRIDHQWNTGRSTFGGDSYFYTVPASIGVND
jgi:hypothetical protein